MDRVYQCREEFAMRSEARSRAACILKIRSALSWRVKAKAATHVERPYMAKMPPAMRDSRVTQTPNDYREVVRKLVAPKVDCHIPERGRRRR